MNGSLNIVMLRVLGLLKKCDVSCGCCGQDAAVRASAVPMSALGTDIRRGPARATSALSGAGQLGEIAPAPGTMMDPHADP